MGLTRLGSANTGRLVTKANASGENTLGTASVTATTGASPWGLIIASISPDFLVTSLVVTLGGGNMPAGTAVSVDLGVGGSGAENSLANIPIMPVYAGSTTRLGWAHLVVPLRIGSGSRLTVRYTDNAGAASGSSVSIAVLGVFNPNVEGN